METKPVETNPPVAGGEVGVETTQSKAPEIEVDFVKLYDEALAERDKAIKIAADWKKVGLARKKGEAVADPVTLSDDDVEKRAQELAQAMVADQTAASAQKRADDIARAALVKQNSELKIALKNKTGMTTTIPTTSTEGAEPPRPNKHGWSEAQVKELLARKVDPVKAWENYQRVKP